MFFGKKTSSILRAARHSLPLWPCTRWDEIGSDGTDPTVHRYILHFFLEDGTVEMRELADIKGGETAEHGFHHDYDRHVRPLGLGSCN